MVFCSDAHIFVCQIFKSQNAVTNCLLQDGPEWWAFLSNSFRATAARHGKYRNGHQRGGFIFIFHPCRYLGSFLCRFPCHCQDRPSKASQSGEAAAICLINQLCGCKDLILHPAASKQGHQWGNPSFTPWSTLVAAMCKGSRIRLRITLKGLEFPGPASLSAFDLYFIEFCIFKNQGGKSGEWQEDNDETTQREREIRSEKGEQNWVSGSYAKPKSSQTSLSFITLMT